MVQTFILSLFVDFFIFLSFQFCPSFVWSFVLFFFVISVLFAIFLSYFCSVFLFQFWPVIFCHLVEILSCFGHFGAIFSKTWKHIENCLRNDKK